MIAALRDRLARRDDSPFFARVTGVAPARRYLIATAGRAGSTLLCSRIAEHGVLGFPNEFLNESYIAEFDRLFPNPSLADFERYVARSFTSDDGVFGLKTDWWRFNEARRLELFRRFYEPLDLAVYLRRDDFVAQAVSLELAMATQLWHARDEGDADFSERQAEAAFDADRIEAQARNILNQEFYWTEFLKGCGAPVTEITYEALARDVDGAVQTIADAFGLRLARRATPPRLQKPRSTVAEAWRERFRGERADFVTFWTAKRGLLTAST
jgi:LPS sulfotransferase NodH